MTIPTLCNSEIALLGLLAEEPKHPYQIEKEIEYREMRLWTDLSKSIIYKLLRRLEGLALVAARTGKAHGNRFRKVYALTERGKKALHDGIKVLLTQPEIVKFSFHTGIYNQDVLSASEIRHSLAQYKKRLAKQITCWKKLEEFMHGMECPHWHLAVPSRFIAMARAEMQWLDGYVKKLR